MVEKLDVTSLPSAIRAKKEKTKKTFADYGFMAQRVDEQEAILEAEGGTRKFSIKILDQQSSRIYVCVAEPVQNGGEAKTQSVFLLKRKDSKGWLKGGESFREFAACPVVAGSDQDSAASAYGGDCNTSAETRCALRSAAVAFSPGTASGHSLRGINARR